MFYLDKFLFLFELNKAGKLTSLIYDVRDAKCYGTKIQVPAKLYYSYLCDQ